MTETGRQPTHSAQPTNADYEVVSNDPPGGTGHSRPSYEALKERIYVTFTALAVTVALARDLDHQSVSNAVITLTMTVFGTLLAVFVADVTASMMKVGTLPTRADISHMLYVSLGSLRVIVAPTVILCFSAVGMLDLADSLRVISLVLVATLIAITLIAVVRVKARAWTKLVVLACVAALGAAVLVVELSIH
ncbi:hypothetical protein [Agreia sp. COWG]|uniref:hypothetical protein n=1 Tax=Agreia sp. COWG TaxID=2773266 RepID=UPI0019270514|nr:hypothetical protein [Agreia sp. COWG]CAD6003132.1 conserved membrane protein of unknown function [Agreia sp. COWG]